MNFLLITLLIILLYIWYRIIKKCSMFDNLNDEIVDSLFKFIDSLKKDFYQSHNDNDNDRKK